MQATIDVNMTALVPQPETGRRIPRVLTLKELLEHFIACRDAAIARRIEADGTTADRAALLDSRAKRMHLIKEDLRRIADAYGDERRTAIEGSLLAGRRLRARPIIVCVLRPTSR